LQLPPLCAIAFLDARWDVRALDEKVRLSQRRRRLVHAAYQKGLTPVWGHNPDEPTIS